MAPDRLWRGPRGSVGRVFRPKICFAALRAAGRSVGCAESETRNFIIVGRSVDTQSVLLTSLRHNAATPRTAAAAAAQLTWGERAAPARPPNQCNTNRHAISAGAIPRLASPTHPPRTPRRRLDAAPTTTMHDAYMTTAGPCLRQLATRFAAFFCASPNHPPVCQQGHRGIVEVAHWPPLTRYSLAESLI